jgi:outer membrane protein assembly factor BamB
MEDGRAPDADDRAGLEAVWGRQASATAPPALRPDIEALFAPPAPAAGGEPPRRRRGPALAGLAVAVVAVAAVVAAVVVLGGEDDPEAGPAPRPGGASTTTKAPAVDDLGPPAWTAATVCPRFEDLVTGEGRVACPVVADDERAYVLVDAAGTPSLRALDLATGQVRWEEPFPQGARTVERLPSVVVVGGVGGTPPTNEGPGSLGEVVALDPLTGERRWSRPGRMVDPVGRDHVIIDATPLAGAPEVVSVVEAATGREVLRRRSDEVPLFIHPCGEEMVLVSEGDRLTAVAVVDGSPRWSIPAPHRDAFRTVRCDDRRIAYVELETLFLLDARTTSTIGAVPVTGRDDDTSQVLALVGETVVVGSIDGARGYRADAGLAELWHLPCTECGPDLLVGATPIGRGYGGEEVVVVIGGEAVVRGAADGASGPRLALDGGTEKVLVDGSLLAWDGGALTWADPVGAGPVARIEVEGVRTAAAAAGAAHVVVATRDEVRAYAREG